jgi:hydroxyacylglutathione hydrolase
VILSWGYRDHAGGNENLVKQMTGGNLSVYGGDDRIKALTEKVKDGTQFKLGNLEVQCLATPCHTTGHICYVIQAPGQSPIVFTGNTKYTIS